LLIIDHLKGLYEDTSAFDYSTALKKLVDEAETYAVKYENGDEFMLVTLESFREICIAKAGKAKLQPSVVRARLGKAFNSVVRRGNVSSVSRAKNSDGSNKFISKTAVYIVDKGKE
jgi:hypothetical protein